MRCPSHHLTRKKGRPVTLGRFHLSQRCRECHPCHRPGGVAAQFLSDYQAAFPDERLDVFSGPYSAFAYDAANMLITAIKTVISSGHDLTRAAVIDQVQHISYEGITGQISFDEHGDNEHPVFSVYQVQNGSWVFLKKINL